MISRQKVAFSILLAAGSAGLARAQAREAQPLEIFRFVPAVPPAEEPREQSLYDQGTRELDRSEWEKAIATFKQLEQLRGKNADAALYWRAFALNKLARRAEALETLQALKAYSKSKWVNDARALEVEVRQAGGQTVAPESVSDEELKLMAINSLMHSDSERAIPMLEKILQNQNSPKLQEKALFVLSQNRSPKAQELMSRVARGKSNPDLQFKALRYLGLFGGKESRQALSEIYASSSDLKVKKSILQSFMLAGERQRVFDAAKAETSAELRGEAVRQLGLMGAQKELSDLYNSEASIEVKKQILNAMFLGGSLEKLSELARSEKNGELRLSAIHMLGLMGGQRSGSALLSIYDTEKDTAIRKQIISSLFIQGNAKALIDLARKESNPELKREIVSKLSLMHSKDAIEYMMEILNK